MAQRIAISATAALALAALIVAILALIKDPAPTPALPPSKGEPSAYTYWFVQQALERYDAQGRQATLDFYNSPQSVDSQWYLFILEEIDGAIYTIAHATRPELVGTTRVRVDSRAFDYGAAFAATTEAGHWVDYVFLNPAIGADQLKHTWIIRHDGLLFGSGWYEDAPDESSSAADGGAMQDPAGFTVDFVQQALRRYDADGREATLAYYSSPQSVDGEWYIFLFEDGIAVGHPDQDVLGQDLRGDLGVDPTGYRFGDVILGVTDEGRWVDYVFRNLATGEDAVKHTWVVRHDGLIFGSGWYENTD